MYHLLMCNGFVELCARIFNQFLRLIYLLESDFLFHGIQ